MLWKNAQQGLRMVVGCEKRMYEVFNFPYTVEIYFNPYVFTFTASEINLCVLPCGTQTILQGQVSYLKTPSTASFKEHNRSEKLQKFQQPSLFSLLLVRSFKGTIIP